LALSLCQQKIFGSFSFVVFSIGYFLIGLFQLFYCTADLLFYPPKHVISADHVCKRWDEEMIKQVFCYLIPENMRVDHVISDFTMEKGMLFFLPCIIFELCWLLQFSQSHNHDFCK